MIECFPESDATTEVESFARITKEDMTKPVHVDENEDELKPCNGDGNPLPPVFPPSDQRVSYERAGDMDFDFLKVG